MQNEQRLYWSVSRPLRWIGLTIDEWFVMLSGIIPGIFLLNADAFLTGLLLIFMACFLCYAFKKFKKVSEYFLIKSYLLSKGFWPKPSKNYPDMLNQKVGK